MKTILCSETFLFHEQGNVCRYWQRPYCVFLAESWRAIQKLFRPLCWFYSMYCFRCCAFYQRVRQSCESKQVEEKLAYTKLGFGPSFIPSNISAGRSRIPQTSRQQPYRRQVGMVNPKPFFSLLKIRVMKTNFYL